MMKNRDKERFISLKEFEETFFPKSIEAKIKEALKAHQLGIRLAEESLKSMQRKLLSRRTQD